MLDKFSCTRVHTPLLSFVSPKNNRSLGVLCLSSDMRVLSQAFVEAWIEIGPARGEGSARRPIDSFGFAIGCRGVWSLENWKHVCAVE